MHWNLLLLAILLEILGTSCMKLSEGLARPIPSILMLLFYAGSFTAMAMALRGIEVGIASAIWSGVGTAAIAFIGIALFGEHASLAKAFWIGLIILGVVGLRLSSEGEAPFAHAADTSRDEAS